MREFSRKWACMAWVLAHGRDSVLQCPLVMRWMAPDPGIAMCPISTALEERCESPFGY